jgi:hypothetical protein
MSQSNGYQHKEVRNDSHRNPYKPLFDQDQRKKMKRLKKKHLTINSNSALKPTSLIGKNASELGDSELNAKNKKRAIDVEGDLRVAANETRSKKRKKQSQKCNEMTLNLDSVARTDETNIFESESGVEKDEKPRKKRQNAIDIESNASSMLISRQKPMPLDGHAIVKNNHLFEYVLLVILNYFIIIKFMFRDSGRRSKEMFSWLLSPCTLESFNSIYWEKSYLHLKRENKVH